MTRDPSAGQPRNRGKYANRVNSPSPVTLESAFPVGARVVGNGTFGFVKEGDQSGGYIPIDDGGSMTVYIKPRYLMNIDEQMDVIMPALERSYAPDDAFDAHGARQAMTILRQLAEDRADRSGHLAYVEAMCALGSQDSTPEDFEAAACMLAGSENLPKGPDYCTPLRASRLARHFTEKASEHAKNQSLVDAAMYADVAVIFAGGPEAAGTKDKISMVSALRTEEGGAQAFLDRVFAGEFDSRAPKPHTYKA